MWTALGLAFTDVAEALKLKQYAEQFPDFNQSSYPSLVILCMERHGSWSTDTRSYWNERVQAAHQRQAATKEIPLAPPCQLSLDGFSRHWPSLSGAPMRATSCSSTAGHVIVLGGLGAVRLCRDSWLAQVVAFKFWYLVFMHLVLTH